MAMRTIRSRILGTRYQAFADSGATLDPPGGLRVLGNTKTDLTLGRSVALVAPLHPKCPIQVRHRRVRAS
jgi:hypothetical protein